MRRKIILLFMACLMILLFLAGCEKKEVSRGADVALTDAQVEDIVRRSYQYVALYNVIQKGAFDATNPASTGGFNKMMVATQLYDHNVKVIARPNNDTLYISCGMDLRKDPVILEIPAFDSKYVSLMSFGYDHIVNVPLTTRLGDFHKPERILFYTQRTQGYIGEAIEGVDRVFEVTSDFAGAVFRVMPHANNPERFQRIVDQMQSVRMMTLAEYQGGEAKTIDDIPFPPFGKTDADIFGGNLLEVMQFIFNHITLDSDDDIDRGVLAAYKPLGLEPGKIYDASRTVRIDEKKFRTMAQKVQKENFDIVTAGDFSKYAPRIFRPKGENDLEAMVLVSVVGPIGLPVEEAAYPAVTTADGRPMNAMNDYVISMKKDELPPARAFWSLTLYDMQNGFFIPNERKKYSVGENAGMKLNDEGGIDIYVAAGKPEGVPSENWLPINRKDENIDIILRIYVPDLEKMKIWQAPKAEMIK
ncbi:MAG: DUF1254 domain-containing protein [Nitrospiraceae bacterium]|nr:MAG: DUF1254 domain-containing protein [Nitrospiraceae bacterium]